MNGIKKPIGIFLLLLIPLFIASFYIGDDYKTKSSILSRTKGIDNGEHVEMFYIAPNAFSVSIRADGYLKNYNDVILRDVSIMDVTKHKFGAWVVVMLEEQPLREGKYVFISGGKGGYYYYDAMNGELISKIEH